MRLFQWSPERSRLAPQTRIKAPRIAVPSADVVVVAAVGGRVRKFGAALEKNAAAFGKDEDQIGLDRAILSQGAGDGDTRALGQLHRSNLNRLPYDRVIVYGRQ